jgi:hypothetical protein
MTVQTVTTERVRALIEAYGADSRRWPEAERAPALALIEARPAEFADALAEADGLDALLHAAPRLEASAALRARVLAAAPKRGWSLGRPSLGKMGWTLAGGWAAAAFAGIVAGVGLTGELTQTTRADAVLYQASLSAVDDVEVLG